MKRSPVVLGVLASLMIGALLTSSSPADEKALMDINPSDFDENSATITNPWHPMTPGTQHVYEGWTQEGNDKIAHRVVFTVTDLVKVINGIEVAVIYELDFSDDRLAEAELTFFAQDKKGNLWHLGQHSEVYDETEFVGGRAWMVGHLDGAKAGIMMKANPRAPSPSYSQGYAPSPFNWTDRARGFKSSQKVEVPFGTFDNVFITEEYNEEEPDAIQLKYYAKDVGVIRVGWSGEDRNKEELVLTEVNRLNAEEMDKVREGARGIETRAYVYATTKPAMMRGLRGGSGGGSSSGAND